jgi:hypothetical protein
VNIGKLSIERRHHRRRQEIRDDDPGKIVEITQVAPDGRQRSGDNRLIDRREEHCHHEAIKDAPHVSLAHGHVQYGATGKLVG